MAASHIQVLINACIDGNLATVKQLVEEQGCDPSGNAPVNVAACGGSLNILKYLIEEKKCSPQSRSLLHYACIKDSNLAAVKYLVEKGCDLFGKDEQENTPLNVAAFNGSLEILKYLVEERKCSPMCPGRWGRLPLHNACEQVGNLPIVKYLVEKHGCDPNSKDNEGNFPLNIAAFSGRFDILKYLIEVKNCSPTSSGKLGRSPLHDACLKNENLVIVKYLVENHTCDPTEKDVYSDTPLHLAALSGSIDIVKYLIEEKGCCLEYPGLLGRSPLHRACARNGNLATVAYLVEQGCDLYYKDRCSLLPLDIAFTGNDGPMINYLKEKMGIDIETTPHGLPSGSILMKDGCTRRWIRINERGEELKWNHPTVQDNIGPMLPDWSVFQKYTGEVIFVNMETAMATVEDPRAAHLRYQLALEDGFVSAYFMKFLIVGAAGVGKTHLLNLLLNEPPPGVRKSTPVMERPVQVIQTMLKDNASFVKITDEMLYRLLAQSINTKKSIHDMTAQKSEISKEAKTGIHVSAAKNICTNLLPGQLYSQDGEKGLEPQSPQYSNNNDISPLEEQLVPYIAKSSKDAAPLSNVDWLYFIDSGGQQQFHQLLPAFMQYTNLNIFVLRLCDKLSDHPIVEYYDERGTCISSTASLLTNKEILQCCAQVTQTADQDGDSRLLIVGTHRDLEHQCDGENREDKNRQLLELLYPSMENTLVYSNADGDEIIFPLNAKTPEDSDRQIIKDLYKSILSIKKRMKPTDVPLKWLIFHQEIQALSIKNKADIINFKQCHQVALSLNMEGDTKIVLEFFSDLNVILYYPSILPNMVFTNPQSLLNIITEIVKQISYSNDAIFIQARKKGIISPRLLDCMMLDFPHMASEPSLFKSQDLIDLLLHLRIVSKCNNDYFMPSLLKGLDTRGIEASLSQHPDSVAPCAVYYENRWPECGAFGFLITSLLNSEGWTLAFEGHRLLCVHSNCIKMYYYSCIVTCVDHVTHIEIHVHGSIDICLKIKQSISNAFKVKPQFALVCPCKAFTERHIAIYTPTLGQQVFCSKNQQKTFSLSYFTNPEVWIKSEDYSVPKNILQSNYDKLLSAIQDPDALAGALYSMEIIASGMRDKVYNATNNCDKNRILLDAVCQQVSITPATYEDFREQLISDQPKLECLLPVFKSCIG